MVATPIGNLADITLRAVQALTLADVVACEDTRVTGGFLRHLGMDKRLVPLHQHNEVGGAQALIELMQAGQRVAYVSDAGTPAVSDPGAHLVQAAQAAGLTVVPLPGASSVTTAMSVAGDTVAQGFRFLGFLPSKGAARQAQGQQGACAAHPRGQGNGGHGVVSVRYVLVARLCAPHVGSTPRFAMPFRAFPPLRSRGAVSDSRPSERARLPMAPPPPWG